MKVQYEGPKFTFMYFETEEVISASGDYDGIDFTDLV